MKSILAALVLVSSSMAFAHGLTCSEAASAVQSEGAVVIHTGTYTYDRYVAHQGYCQRDETTRAAWIHTSDNDACFVGYTCVDRNHNR